VVDAGSIALKLVDVVNEVAARTVGAEAASVEGPAQLSLVARMTIYRAQLQDAVRELTLLAVATRAARLLVRTTQLGLVAGRIGRRRTVVRRRPTSPTTASGRRSRRFGPDVCR